MTIFQYTPDLQDTVTKALGDGWEHNRQYPYAWDYVNDTLMFTWLCFDNGEMKIATHEDCVVFSDLEPLIAEAHAAADRLRAAGLVEVGK